MAKWKLSPSLELAGLLAAAVLAPAQPRLQVVSPTPIALTAKCDKTPCDLGSTPLAVLAPKGQEKLLFSGHWLSSTGHPEQVDITPSSAVAGDNRVAVLQIGFSTKAKLPLRGYLVISSTTESVAVPVTLTTAAATAPDPKPARRQRVEDVLVASLLTGFSLTFFTALGFAVRRKSLSFLLDGIGLATWNTSSLASNTSVLSGLASSVLTIPTAMAVANYTWAIDFALLGILAALLAAAGPLGFNLTSHTTIADGKPVSVNYVLVFLVATLFSIAGLATSWQVLWYAVSDLVYSHTLSRGTGDILWSVLGLLAPAFAFYFVTGIITIIPASPETATKQAEAPPGEVAEERPAPTLAVRRTDERAPREWRVF